MRSSLLAVVLLVAGCELELTFDPPTYDQLDDAERSAADRIFARLQAFDARLRAYGAGTYSLGPIAQEKDRIDVSVVNYWMMVNLGDDRIHLTVWENLTDEQRAHYASWFGESPEAAIQRYGYQFYEFMALHLAGVQTVYAVQGVSWVYENRHMFNVDRDAERLVDNYLAETDPGLSNFIWSTCGSIRGVYDARFGPWYDMVAYGDHVRELTDPHDPAGQIYMICRHLEDADVRRRTEFSSFAAEVDVLERQRSGDY